MKQVLGGGSFVPFCLIWRKWGWCHKLTHLSVTKSFFFLIIRHFKCHIFQISDLLNTFVYWVYLSYDYSILSSWRAGSKLRGCGGMLYAESSGLTVLGFNLTGEILVKVKYEKIVCSRSFTVKLTMVKNSLQERL